MSVECAGLLSYLWVVCLELGRLSERASRERRAVLDQRISISILRCIYSDIINRPTLLIVVHRTRYRFVLCV